LSQHWRQSIVSEHAKRHANNDQPLRLSRCKLPMRAVATINAESVCALATSLAKLRVAGRSSLCAQRTLRSQRAPNLHRQSGANSCARS
jgi:hypothetical protein